MRKRQKGRIEQRERRIKHGDYMTVQVFPVFEYDKAGRRGKKKNPTSEVQKKLNQRYAEDKIKYLLNENFNENDIAARLSFSDDFRPDTYTEVQRITRNFLASIRRFNKKNDLEDLKYIYTIEKGKKNGNFHLHIIMNNHLEPVEVNGVKMSYLKYVVNLWQRYSGCKAVTFDLEFDDEGLKVLGKYLLKEPESEIAVIDEKVRRWSTSKNLKKPEITERTNFISRETVKDIREGNVTEREIERLYPGYTITEWEPKKNNINAGEYLTIQLRRTKITKTAKEVFSKCGNTKQRSNAP